MKEKPSFNYCDYFHVKLYKPVYFLSFFVFQLTLIPVVQVTEENERQWIIVSFFFFCFFCVSQINVFVFLVSCVCLLVNVISASRRMQFFFFGGLILIWISLIAEQTKPKPNQTKLFVENKKKKRKKIRHHYNNTLCTLKNNENKKKKIRNNNSKNN